MQKCAVTCKELCMVVHLVLQELTSKHSAEASPRAKEASMTSSAISIAGGGAKCPTAEVRTLGLCTAVGMLPACRRSLSEATCIPRCNMRNDSEIPVGVEREANSETKQLTF